MLHCSAAVSLHKTCDRTVIPIDKPCIRMGCSEVVKGILHTIHVAEDYAKLTEEQLLLN